MTCPPLELPRAPSVSGSPCHSRAFDLSQRTSIVGRPLPRQGRGLPLARRTSIATTRMPLAARRSSTGALAVRSWSFQAHRARPGASGTGLGTLRLVDAGHEGAHWIASVLNVPNLDIELFCRVVCNGHLFFSPISCTELPEPCPHTVRATRRVARLSLDRVPSVHPRSLQVKPSHHLRRCV